MTALSFNSSTLSSAIRRNLSSAEAGLSAAFARLSSGQRITQPSDDIAGYYVAEKAKISERLYAQGVRNVNDGLSALNVVQSALDELKAITTRQQELATQAANGAYSLTQRRALNMEADALVAEFNRIVESVKFNGRGLLDGSTTSLSLQAGWGEQSAISFAISEELARTVGDGSIGSTSTKTMASAASVRDAELVDLNGDGNLDLITANRLDNKIGVALGNGDGTFRAAVSYATGGGPHEITVADFNGDGLADVAANTGVKLSIHMGKGDGTFNAYVSYALGGSSICFAAGDLNGDGRPDIVASLAGVDRLSLLTNRGDGTFAAATSLATADAPGGVEITDINGDGAEDLIYTSQSGGSLQVNLGVGNGTFQAAQAFSASVTTASIVHTADLNRDGRLDAVITGYGSNSVSVMLGGGDGSFVVDATYSTGTAPASFAVGDIDGDGLMDVVTSDYNGNTVSILRGRGDGTLASAESYAAGAKPTGISLGDIDNDGGMDIAVANWTANTAKLLFSDTHSLTTMPYLNMRTQEDALAALEEIKRTAARIVKEQAELGGMESRLSFTVNNLAVMRENYSAAYDSITSVDVAEEVARMVRFQVLQQAGTAMLAQANAAPEILMQLLQ